MPVEAFSLSTLLNWFAEVQNSLKGYLNVEELVKSVVTALGSGATILGVLQAIQAHLSAIVLDPTLLAELNSAIANGVSKNWVALVVGVLALVTDIYRRLNHGVTPTPVPVPTPTPTPPPNVTVG